MVENKKRLNAQEVRLEELYLGLRTADGLPAERVAAETIGRWSESGWASVLDGKVRLTPEGWLRLDALVASVSA